jgi:hypothetical protein
MTLLFGIPTLFKQQFAETMKGFSNFILEGDSLIVTLSLQHPSITQD